MNEEEKLAYQTKVFAWLDSLSIGNVKNITNVADKELFVETVKSYIDCTGRVEFSNDYKKIRVIETYQELIEKQKNYKSKYESTKYTTKPRHGTS